MATGTISRLQNDRVASELRGRVVRNTTRQTSFGAVATAAGAPIGQSRAPSSITYTLTNAGGVPLTYVIGDPKFVVAGAFGVVWTQPSAVQGQVVAAVQESFDSNSVSVKGWNLKATDVTVLAQAFRYLYGDVNGATSGTPINIQDYVRNNAFDPTRVTLDFSDSPYVLDMNHCFTVVVPAAQALSFTLTLGDSLR